MNRRQRLEDDIAKLVQREAANDTVRTALEKRYTGWLKPGLHGRPTLTEILAQLQTMARTIDQKERDLNDWHEEEVTT
jgi:hypothetical protein